MPATAHHQSHQRPREDVVLAVLQRPRDGDRAGRCPPRLGEKVFDAPLRRLARFVRVVSRGQGDREEGRGTISKSGAVGLDPVDKLLLVVGGV